MTDTIETFSLKGARNEFDYTQQQIADKLGVSRAQYIAWEKEMWYLRVWSFML